MMARAMGSSRSGGMMLPANGVRMNGVLVALIACAALCVARLREVAPPLKLGRHGGEKYVAAPPARALVIGKKERLAAPVVARRAEDFLRQPDGATDRAAKLVHAKRRLLATCAVVE